jgi:hypothetical protein
LSRSAALLPALLVSLAACGQGAESHLEVHVQSPSGGAFVLPADVLLPVILVRRHLATGLLRWSVPEGAHPGVVRYERPRPGEDVLLWVAGCREEVLPREASGVPIRLMPGPKVRLRVVSPRGLLDPPRYVEVELRWRGPGDLPEAPLLDGLGHGGAAPLGWADRTRASLALLASASEHHVVLNVSRAGRYRVQWSLAAVSSGSRSGYSSSRGHLTIDVLDTSREQVFDIPVSTADLVEADAALRR